jgi:hypothetical protein
MIIPYWKWICDNCGTEIISDQEWLANGWIKMYDTAPMQIDREYHWCCKDCRDSYLANHEDTIDPHSPYVSFYVND